MPMNKALYPSNWTAIALQKKQQANWTCENCGKPCRQTGESLPDFVERVRTAPISECRLTAEIVTHPQRFTLTVSHTNHDPWNPHADLRALCAPCHCRYDIDPVQMDRKRKAKLEYFGQLTLEVE